MRLSKYRKGKDIFRLPDGQYVRSSDYTDFFCIVGGIRNMLAIPPDLYKDAMKCFGVDVFEYDRVSSDWDAGTRRYRLTFSDYIYEGVPVYCYWDDIRWILGKFGTYENFHNRVAGTALYCEEKSGSVIGVLSDASTPEQGVGIGVKCIDNTRILEFTKVLKYDISYVSGHFNTLMIPEGVVKVVHDRIMVNFVSTRDGEKFDEESWIRRTRYDGNNRIVFMTTFGDYLIWYQKAKRFKVFDVAPVFTKNMRTPRFNEMTENKYPNYRQFCFKLFSER